MSWLQSFAQEETAQGMLTFGVVSSVGGIQNKIGTPEEMACVLAEVQYVLEVARRVAKPDMFLGRSSATSPGAIMALFFPGAIVCGWLLDSRLRGNDTGMLSPGSKPQGPA